MMTSPFACISRWILPTAAAVFLAGCSGDLNQMVAAGFGQTPYGSEGAQRDVDVAARGPLVLPPDSNLPAPSDKEAETQQLGANWPTDPEEVQKRLVKERQERLAALEARKRSSKRASTDALSSQEMEAWGKGLPVGSVAPGVGPDRGGQIMTPQDLKSYGSEEDPAIAGIPPEQQPLPPLPR